jgi:serine protease inhibitor
VEVIVDRPFLFAITDMESGLPLFLGRVTDPTAG